MRSLHLDGVGWGAKMAQSDALRISNPLFYYTLKSDFSFSLSANMRTPSLCYGKLNTSEEHVVGLFGKLREALLNKT